MLRFVAILAACGLLLAQEARAEEAERPQPLVLQATAGVVGGLLAEGYAALLANRLRFENTRTMTLAPLPFAVGSALAVWLTGRWSGVMSDPSGTFLGAAIPAVVGTLLAAVGPRRDLAVASLFAAPVLSVVGAVVGFGLARGDAGSGGETPVRRAAAEERTF